MVRLRLTTGSCLDPVLCLTSRNSGCIFYCYECPVLTVPASVRNGESLFYILFDWDVCRFLQSAAVKSWNINLAVLYVRLFVWYVVIMVSFYMCLSYGRIGLL